MKKLVTTTAIMFCVMSSDAQTTKTNYIRRDTIEILYYDSLGNEYHYNPSRTVIKRTEVGDPEYWKRRHKRERRWNIISLGIFAAGVTIMFLK